MESLDLYQSIGARDGSLRLSEAFYARVKRDPVLRPLFPGKTLKCAIHAFAAFLAQFLGGPAEDARERWWLSLRQSHARFAIGTRERQAWMSNMVKALEDVTLEEPVRLAFRQFFERASAYLVNTGPSVGLPHALQNPSGDPFRREISQRWTEQQALDDLVAAIQMGDERLVLELTTTRQLQARFARDRAVFAHALGLMLARANPALLEYAEGEISADPSLARVRNRYGLTLLHDASARGNLRMVELLLRLGADPNDALPRGRTPLYCLANECRVGGARIVRALVKAGAQVDALVGATRCTALHVAARRGNTEIAQALLDCGANRNVRDSAGDTPLQRAKNCRKADVASLLRPKRASRAANAPPPKAR